MAMEVLLVKWGYYAILTMQLQTIGIWYTYKMMHLEQRGAHYSTLHLRFMVSKRLILFGRSTLVMSK